MSRRVAAVVIAWSVPLLAACGGGDDTASGGDSSSSSSEAPKTLEAATAAAQEYGDRVQSEDYAGTWDLMSKEYRVGVKRADWVAYNEACTFSGPEITATGVRMEGEDAVVRLEVAGQKATRTMVHESGAWHLAPSDSGRKDIGKDSAQMIADAKAEDACMGGE